MHSAEGGKTAEAGRRLLGNRYLVHEAIGRGGYGVVWRGHDTLLGREVALKEIRLLPALSSTGAGVARSRVMQEARASAVVTNAHAITVYDIIQEEDDGDLHIVMELLDGRTLSQLVEEEGALSPLRAATIGLQVLDALEAAHAKGVVHRDVKPGNVMVMAEDQVKLGDFGLASLAGDSDLTMTGEVVGTPSYMAPEQASGEDAGPPADLWGLGATLYFAVEGVAPFGGGSSMSTMLAVVNAPPRPYARAGTLTGVLDRLLVKLPEERPGPDELRTLLAEVADGGGTEEHVWARVTSVPAQGSGPAHSSGPHEPPDAYVTAPTIRTAHVATRTRRRRRWGVALVAALLPVAAALWVVLAPVLDAPDTGGQQSIVGAGRPNAVVPAPTTAAPTPTPAPATAAPTTTAPTTSAPITATSVEDAAAAATTAGTDPAQDDDRLAAPPPPPPPPAPPQFEVEARSAAGQGNAARLTAGAGTIELTTQIVDGGGQVVAGMKMSKFRTWDGVRVTDSLAVQLETFDDPGRGVTFVGLAGPVLDESNQGGKTHTSRAVAVFRACGKAGDCRDLRALVEIVAFGDGTFDTRRGPV